LFPNGGGLCGGGSKTTKKGKKITGVLRSNPLRGKLRKKLELHTKNNQDPIKSAVVPSPQRVILPVQEECKGD